MLFNPFTPSEIASDPENFFGRLKELDTLERSLLQGSVAIQGAIGIGKSSLLARCRHVMEGFGSAHKAKCAVVVGDKDIATVDNAARLCMESFVFVDEKQEQIKFKLGSIFEKSSGEICKYFVEGRHLAAFKRIVEQEFLSSFLSNDELLLVMVDEADKCPIALARLIRAVVTHTQQQGVKRVRFALAGVSPFFQRMVDEDQGINRFFYKTITLEPMPEEEATDLIETKLGIVTSRSAKEQLEIRLEPTIVPRVVALSGGHPHILQLLGSHLIEHENDDPDGVIDSRDLVGSLRRICYEDRVRVYDSTLHNLETYGRLDPLNDLLRIARPGFPTKISKRKATEIVDGEEIRWLVDNAILTISSDTHYGLVDEFLRIRLMLDQLESDAAEKRFEKELLSYGIIENLSGFPR